MTELDTIVNGMSSLDTIVQGKESDVCIAYLRITFPDNRVNRFPIYQTHLVSASNIHIQFAIGNQAGNPVLEPWHWVLDEGVAPSLQKPIILVELVSLWNKPIATETCTLKFPSIFSADKNHIQNGPIHLRYTQVIRRDPKQCQVVLFSVSIEVQNDKLQWTKPLIKARKEYDEVKISAEKRSTTRQNLKRVREEIEELQKRQHALEKDASKNDDEYFVKRRKYDTTLSQCIQLGLVNTNEMMEPKQDDVMTESQ
jgi:hypothetical protein